MLLATLVLVSVDGEHDGLEQRIDFSHGDETAEMRNVSRLGLQEEQQIAVFLRLVVVGEEALLELHAFFEVACDFVLLWMVSSCSSDAMVQPYLLERHAILNEQRYP
jgi:hypothetical protein